MQIKCQKENCSGDLILGDEIKLSSEIGFSKNERTFQCQECGAKYVICQECEGEGFSQTPHGIIDCEICNGSGLILIVL
jgi:hypothetical protein